MRSVAQGLIPNDCFPSKKRGIWTDRQTHTHTHTEKGYNGPSEDKTDFEKAMCYRCRDWIKGVANPASPRIDGLHQMLGEEGVLHSTYERKNGPTDSLSWPSFQNWERINFCSSEPSSWWHLRIAALENASRTLYCNTEVQVYNLTGSGKRSTIWSIWEVRWCRSSFSSRYIISVFRTGL